MTVLFATLNVKAAVLDASVGVVQIAFTDPISLLNVVVLCPCIRIPVPKFAATVPDVKLCEVVVVLRIPLVVASHPFAVRPLANVHVISDWLPRIVEELEPTRIQPGAKLLLLNVVPFETITP